jgi:hypothetical protein
MILAQAHADADHRGKPKCLPALLLPQEENTAKQAKPHALRRVSSTPRCMLPVAAVAT